MKSSEEIVLEEMAKHKFSALPLKKDIFNINLKNYSSININNLNTIKFPNPNNNTNNKIYNVESNIHLTSRKKENVNIFFLNLNFLKI